MFFVSNSTAKSWNENICLPRRDFWQTRTKNLDVNLSPPPPTPSDSEQTNILRKNMSIPNEGLPAVTMIEGAIGRG
ncbi:hypothetical protein JZ751_002313 [Albula glossodonta]|uniref:Uncharacterized protein n=1 Tax=Albula glossodonta TaxID=121402 RepID=A0A8T2PIC0_9TELE|nr:hypothetical protein JZ751_002313 [Albula glossodonta]